LLDSGFAVRSDPDRAECAPNPLNGKRPEISIGRRHRRYGWVQEAVIRVLEQRKAPMQAREVHAAVEALLGEPVRWGSVKACLAANVAGSSPRFVRVARGRYAAISFELPGDC
jgi:hypothetical protein